MSIGTVLRCSKCLQDKGTADFGRDSSCRRGYSYNCKECKKVIRKSPEGTERDRLSRERNKHKHTQRIKDWAVSNKDRVKEVRGEWRKNNAGVIKLYASKYKEKTAVRKKRYRSVNKHKSTAHYLVSCALTTGELVKLPCHICDDPHSQAHHEDYTKPLEVMWLCQTHHSRRHEELMGGN